VAANNLYDGLVTASDLFVGTTLTALEALQQLHTYLLAASLLLFGGLLLLLLLPFRRRLVMESLRLAGLLSQLPQVRLRLCVVLTSALALDSQAPCRPCVTPSTGE
jgi:hypothetical protein